MSGSAAPVVLFLDGRGDQVGAQVGWDRVEAAHVHDLHAVLDRLFVVLLNCAHRPGHLACETTRQMWCFPATTLLTAGTAGSPTKSPFVVSYMLSLAIAASCAGKCKELLLTWWSACVTPVRST